MVLSFGCLNSLIASDNCLAINKVQSDFILITGKKWKKKFMDLQLLYLIPHSM